ncbi:MAG TPA: hypothetical protein VHS79_03880 [Actinomycetes bacterium]|nr:hypothetical protein [Actinomycetes bacterium]
MASRTVNGDRARIGARTLRKDRWWLAPVVTVTVLAGFVIYGTWVAFANRDYFADPYLSPFYSPCLAASCEEPTWAIVGSWWPLSPALLVLPFPLGFRLTCYYYRKAYYRSFWLSPPACAVAEPHGKYSGETRLPLILNNVHRYFFYASLVVAAVLTFDTVLAFRDENGEWGHMGLGTVLFVVNIALIWAYTLGCHSCRHVVGGRLRHFSKHPLRYRAWTLVSRLNAQHARYAWLSLFSVALADLYVYLLATGTITDPRFF